VHCGIRARILQERFGHGRDPRPLLGFGVPAGVTLGRQLWDLFARAIYAVPEPTVPVWPVILIVLGALVLANIAAAIPGRIAARTPAAGLLRA
jgi:ABC-type lipoprotein release transport system permease subunit